LFIVKSVAKTCQFIYHVLLINLLYNPLPPLSIAAAAHLISFIATVTCPSTVACPRRARIHCCLPSRPPPLARAHSLPLAPPLLPRARAYSLPLALSLLLLPPLAHSPKLVHARSMPPLMPAPIPRLLLFHQALASSSCACKTLPPVPKTYIIAGASHTRLLPTLTLLPAHPPAPMYVLRLCACPPPSFGKIGIQWVRKMN